MGDSVTFLRKRTLVSTKAVEARCKIHELSVLDLMMEKHHLNIIHYYNTRLGLPLGELSTKMRDDLSETLSYFPVVIGRLMKEMGKWVIKCNDAGLRFVEAKAMGSVEEWLENVDDEKEKMLVHWEDMCHVPYHWSTFYVKVTEFEGGGLALGLSCAHMMTDSICATLFLKAVTDMLLKGRVSVPPFFHSLPRSNNNNNNRLNLEKSHQNPNNDLINTYKSLLQSRSPLVAQHYKTMALEFKHDMVQSCMNLAQLNGPTHDAYSHACIALVALLWNCISRVKGMRHGLVDMSICSNTRKILGLDQGFFGNCMIYNRVLGGDGIRVDDLMSSTKAIKAAIENVNRDEILELIEWLEHYNHDHSSSFVVEGDNLEFINLEDMDPYSNIFTQGYEPIRVSYYSESMVEKDKVLILPSPPNQGQLSKIVMITLPSDQLMRLCEDKHLTRYSPVILMGAKQKGT